MHVHKEIPIATLAGVKSDAVDLAARAITRAADTTDADKAEVAAQLRESKPSFERDLALEATQFGLGNTITVDEATSRLQDAFEFIANVSLNGSDILSMGAAEVAISKSMGTPIVTLMIGGGQERVIANELKLHDLAVAGAS